MRRCAAVALTVWLVCTPVSAETATPTLSHGLAACQAWREHIVHLAEMRVRTGSLDRAVAEVVTDAAGVLLDRCKTQELREVLRQFSLLHDFLQPPDDMF